MFLLLKSWVIELYNCWTNTFWPVLYLYAFWSRSHNLTPEVIISEFHRKNWKIETSGLKWSVLPELLRKINFANFNFLFPLPGGRWERFLAEFWDRATATTAEAATTTPATAAAATEERWETPAPRRTDF